MYLLGKEQDDVDRIGVEAGWKDVTRLVAQRMKHSIQTEVWCKMEMIYSCCTTTLSKLPFPNQKIGYAKYDV